MSETRPSTRARYTYRLRLSKAARRALAMEWDRCRWVWNQCVAESKNAHKAKVDCGPAKLDKMLTGWRRDSDWLKLGKSVAQQQTIRDFAKARTRALKDIKNRVPVARRSGMPKFKKKHRTSRTLNYTKHGFRLKDGRLRLAGGIDLVVVWSRSLPSQPGSVRVFQDSLGHWYASFVVLAAVEALPATGRVIGIDWGVRQTATTNHDDFDLPHPEHGRHAAVRLARYQRMMVRRRPAKGKPESNRHRNIKKLVAEVHRKVARQRRDTAYKWAKAVVRDHDTIAVEDFRPKFLAKSTMSRKAADAAISATKAALAHMAGKHSRRLILVNPMHTTTDCGRCGARATLAIPLSQRIYTCTTCGTSRPRDKNSALVMLNRAGLNPASADRIRPGRPMVARAV